MILRSVGALYFFSFTFFLLDQKETKNQGHKNAARSARSIKERYPCFKNRGYLQPIYSLVVRFFESSPRKRS
jgi:hypothetical protein